MKKIVIAFCFVSILIAGAAFAGDQNNNPTGTIVGSELLTGRYQYVDPGKKTEKTDVTKDLVDSGKITTVKDAQVNGQASAAQGK